MIRGLTEKECYIKLYGWEVFLTVEHYSIKRIIERYSVGVTNLARNTVCRLRQIGEEESCT